MTNRFPIACLLTALSCWGTASCSRPPENDAVHVAAAANLRDALEELARAFQTANGSSVVPTFGPTAQLTQQIENGAPVDVFLSADTQHVDELIDRNLADKATRAVYARGRLVLWAPNRPDITTLSDLARPDVKQVGCARPELAPYGAAAVQALEKEKLWKIVEPKLVYAQSISASKQFADSGNVDAAFTALSLVSKLPGHSVTIPEDLHIPIDQALCIVKQGPQPAAAARFRAFVLSTEGRAILTRYGYAQPAQP
jgi:molybdate transport system substrate-binding protein